MRQLSILDDSVVMIQRWLLTTGFELNC